MSADIEYSAMDRTGEMHVIGVAPESCGPASPRELARGEGQLPFSQTEHVLTSLAMVLEQRDKHTAGHCGRLAVTGVALGVAMKLEGPNLLALYLGGILHDVGKVGIPDSVLLKPGQLNAEEWEIMRSHSVRGEEICRPLSSLRCALPIIRHHHEKWDGSGYPDGLAGPAIPLLARVIQVADIYDALTNPRPYKSAFPAARALEVIEEESARGWRDPDVTRVFVSLHKGLPAKISACRTDVIDARSMQESFAHLQDFLAH